MLRRPDGVPGAGRARRPRSPMSTARKFALLRWGIIAAWAALLVVRIVVVATSPDTDLVWFGIVEAVAVAVGVALIVGALVRARTVRLRREDEALAVAIRRIDPTVWLVPAAPTDELRRTVADLRPASALGDRVTWAFGATEASLWELDERKATRMLVIRWSRMVHVGLEDERTPSGTRGTAVVLHHVRPDDSPAVATFFVRSGPGSRRMLGRGPRLDRLVAALARERIVA